MADGNTTDLQKWLDQLQHGDAAAIRQAQDAIIQHTCERLEQLTRKMLRHYPRLRRWEQTGDVLQNALVRLHRSLENVHPQSAGQFYGLAATQIRRELIDLARHHFGPHGAGANHHSDGDGTLLRDEHASSAEPITMAEWTEFHQQVEGLPDAEREVFELLWYEGLGQEDAAKILGVTSRTIKSRWRSAKLLLQSRLAGGDSCRRTT